VRPNSVLCIGECMLEMVSSSAPAGQSADNLGVRLAYGGDTLNTAAHLAAAGCDRSIEVSYMTMLGSDILSARMIEDWQRRAINTELVSLHPKRLPGIYLIETDANGERDFHYWREQSAARLLFDDPHSPPLDALMRFGLVYTSGITLAVLTAAARDSLLDVLAEYRDAGGRLAFDCNYRDSLWQSLEDARGEMDRVWSLADIALPGIDDLRALYTGRSEAEIVSHLLQFNPAELIIKRGADAPLLYAQGREVCAPQLQRVHEVVDSTGAGDSFNAGYLHARLCGGEITEAVRTGHAIASRVIQHRGALPD